jgi:CRP/FNR family transcriptional regulator, cyclic AMP receptor protein
MKERFEESGRLRLIEALLRQEIVSGNGALAKALARHGETVEFQKGDRIIIEGGEDLDIYLLVSGSVAVVIKGNQINTRRAGQHIGEMAAIEPAQRRSASTVALETVVALKVSSLKFHSIANEYPEIWLTIARELARRLFQRNALIPTPNEHPRLFIISSTEALRIAREIRSQLKADVLSTVWNEGTFFAGGYSLEALEKAVNKSDFAVAVAQPDDIIKSRGVKHSVVRDNVLFELGLFMGKLTRYRAILVYPEAAGLKLPSDLNGLTFLSYRPGTSSQLRSRLRPACNQIRKLVAELGVRKSTS